MNLPEYAERHSWVRAVLDDLGVGRRNAAEILTRRGNQTVTPSAVQRYRDSHKPKVNLADIFDKAGSGFERPRKFGPGTAGATAMATPATETLSTHILIPDTQAKAGVSTDHLRWIGQYIVDEFSNRENVKIIHIGDHADMPSLSSYDQGKKAMEGRRYKIDIEAANEAFAILNEPIARAERDLLWLPDKHITLGNHEERIVRAVESDAQLEGIISLDDLNYSDFGWTVHNFLKPVFLDGVGYVHFWANPMSGKPYGGMALTRLKTLGHSFTMGHQQTLDYALRFVRDREGSSRSQHALIAGACYLHDEDYKGYQGNAHWRGIVVKHEVNNGSYDPMFVSLEYLRRRYA